MDDNLNILFSRKDDAFSPDRTGDYNLIACLNANSLSYCIRDAVNDKFIALETIKDTLEKILVHYPWMKRPFRSVQVVIETTKFTLVPLLLYDDSAQEKLLDFTVERESGERILSDHLQHPEVYNLYPVTESLMAQIRQNFPDSGTRHIASVMIETIWINFKNRINTKKLFLHIREENFGLVVFDGTLLHYSNAFPYKAPEDIAYFVIFVMEQLDLNPEETGAVLMGDIDRKSPLYEILFRYIRNLEFPARSDAVKVSPVFHDVPDQQYYLLLNPVLCGS